ncbi:hypothetical protein ABIA33_003053 [Streptacidiphilus sp. MAP12-16]
MLQQAVDVTRPAEGGPDTRLFRGSPRPVGYVHGRNGLHRTGGSPLRAG